MKKSEALNKLDNAFNWGCENGPDREAILDFIEKELGMLPPTFFLNDSGYVKFNDLKDFYEIDGSPQWEVEDETW